MLFASTTLAARIERADCRSLRTCIEAVGRRRPEEPVLALPLAGGLATYAGPDSPLNKLAGLGFDGPLVEDELEEIERAFAERHAPLQVELSNLADPEVGARLTCRGYVLRGFENVLGRPLPAEPPELRPTDVEVAPCGAGEFATWLDVVVTGFSHPDEQGVATHEAFSREALERAIGDLSEAEGFARYLARRAGVPAGGADMRLSEGVAQLLGAATLPEHRRRGVQTALLSARLALAAREGCDVAVVTTLPGSKSQENVQRRGFELLYTRAILVREP